MADNPIDSPPMPAPHIDEVYVESPRFFRARITRYHAFLIVVLGGLGGLTGIFASTLPRHLSWIGVAIYSVFVGVSLGVMQARRAASAARKLRAIAAVTPPLEFGVLAQQAAGIIARPFVPAGKSDMLRVFLNNGGRGRVARFGPTESVAPVRPLTVAIEPRLIDENDPAIYELTQGGAAGRSEASDYVPPPTDAQRMKRHFLRGGWILLAIFVLNALFAGIESYRRKAITWQLAMWLGLIAMQLLAFKRSKSFSPLQWLAVNGGIVVRKRRGMHLYRRTDSVMLLRAMQRFGWFVSLVDDSQQDEFVMSDDEAAFMLAAWFSALPTPPLERLSDLA